MSKAEICADPGIFVRGGGGGPGQSDKKSSEEEEFYHFSRFQRGSNIFQGGPTFSRGCPIAYSL